MNIQPYSLAWYTEIAKHKPVDKLAYAVQDINHTLSVMRERDTRDPYIAKLLAEMDAYTTELLLRSRKLVRRK